MYYYTLLYGGLVTGSIFSTHMQDLQEVTQEVHYENFRAERLANGTAPPKKTKYVTFLYNFIKHVDGERG